MLTDEKNSAAEREAREHRTTRIAARNDLARRGQVRCRILRTAGIHALPFGDQIAIVGKVRHHDTFTADNDKYHEHDFGSFDYDGQRIFWKIDYYAKGKDDEGSEFPEDPNRTDRVLTIMLGSEY